MVKPLSQEPVSILSTSSPQKQATKLLLFKVEEPISSSSWWSHAASSLPHTSPLPLNCLYHN